MSRCTHVPVMGGAGSDVVWWRWLICCVCVALVLMVTGCSNRKTAGLDAIDGVKELKQLRELKNSTRTSSVGSSGIRVENIKQTARELGAQSGLSYQTNRLNLVLEHQGSLLNRVFNFNYLMLNKQVLPPVLVEADGLLTQEDEHTLRISDHIYRIVQQPRFVTTPPNWRNYLVVNYPVPEIPNPTLLPKNAREQAIWRHYVRIGWAEGVEQADLIFTTNLAKLKRDFLGMVLYRKLLAQKMITPPYTAQADLGVVGDAQSLDINSKILRITAVPQFTVDHSKWRPVIAPQQQP